MYARTYVMIDFSYPRDSTAENDSSYNSVASAITTGGGSGGGGGGGKGRLGHERLTCARKKLVTTSVVRGIWPTGTRRQHRTNQNSNQHRFKKLFGNTTKVALVD